MAKMWNFTNFVRKKRSIVLLCSPCKGEYSVDVINLTISNNFLNCMLPTDSITNRMWFHRLPDYFIASL